MTIQIAKTGRKYNVVSLCIAKQVYDAASTASAHHRTISGSTLVSSPRSTAPTSPRVLADGTSTARVSDWLAHDSKIEEAWDETLQEDCNRRMLALADGVDLAWVPAKTKRNFQAQEARINNDKYWCSSMERLVEEHDKEKAFLEERLSTMTARKAQIATSEDTVNTLKKKHADDLSSLEVAAQKQKRTMQAIIDDQAKNLEATRRINAKYEMSNQSTIQQGGSLLSDNLRFVKAQKKIRNQLMGTGNNLGDSTPRSRTCDHAKKVSEQRDHKEKTSERDHHMALIKAKEEIAKLKARNDELTNFKNDLTSQMEEKEERVVELRNKLKDLNERVGVQEELTKTAKNRLKSDTAAYELMLEDQAEYYQQSLTTLKNNDRTTAEDEAKIRNEIIARFQKQLDDAMEETATLGEEANARLERQFINMKARCQQLVKYYAHLSIDLLEYLLKMEKLFVREGYVIGSQDYELFIAKARRDLLCFKREGDGDAIFFGDEEESEDDEIVEEVEEDESKNREDSGKIEGDYQGGQVVGLLAIEWRAEAITEDVDDNIISDSASFVLDKDVRKVETGLRIPGEELVYRDPSLHSIGINGEEDVIDDSSHNTTAPDGSVGDDLESELASEDVANNPDRAKAVAESPKTVSSIVQFRSTSCLDEAPIETSKNTSSQELSNYQPLLFNNTPLLESQGAQAPAIHLDLNTQPNFQGYQAARKFSFPTGLLPNPQSSSIPATALVHTAVDNQKAGSIPKKANTDSIFDNCQEDDTKAIATIDTATLSLDVIAFADTSRSAYFTTPPPSPPPSPPPGDPQPVQEEPRTKSGKARAQVTAEVALALALRNTNGEKSANTSCSALFTTPPPSPLPSTPHPPPSEPRTKLGKTRAQVTAEVALALASRATQNAKKAADQIATKEKKAMTKASPTVGKDSKKNNKKTNKARRRH